MNNFSKTLILTSFSFIVMFNVSSAQHSHGGHHSKENVQKTKELPSGLSQMNHEQNMNHDSTSDDTHMNMGNHGHMHMKNHDMNMDSADVSKSPLIREDEIDLNSIDENKDGKVYQDVMDGM